MMSLNNLRFFVFSLRDTDPMTRSCLTTGYQLWRSVWLDAFSELDRAKDLFSDDFTRQESIGLLLNGEEAVGSLFFSTVDLSNEMWRKDSYFKVWPVEILDHLAKVYPGPRILVCSYFTLAQRFRRDSPGFSAKRLLTSLGVEHLKASNCDAMLGTMRVNRGMHSICYEVGAQPLAKGLSHHSVDVDLIVFDKSHISDQSIEGPMTNEAKQIYRRSQSERQALLERYLKKAS